MDEGFTGFVVHAFAANVREGHQIHLVGRLQDGRTFAVVERREFPLFYLRSSEAGLAAEILRGENVTADDCGLKTIDGERCVLTRWGSVQRRERAARKLSEIGVRTYEADIRFQDQFLMSRSVHGSVVIRGDPRRGKHVDLVFIDPDIGPSEWNPSLSLLSLDIETDLGGEEIYAIGLVFREPWSGGAKREVLFAGSPGSRLPGSSSPGAGFSTGAPVSGSSEGAPVSVPPTDSLTPGEGIKREAFPVTSFPDERSMLRGFCERLIQWDPDIVTGWNVIDFDFRVIAGRVSHHRIPFRIGRSDVPAAFLPGERSRSDTIIVPGRHVLDAVRLVRAFPERFEDHSLETVARTLLGRGKKLELRKGEKRPEAVARLYREDPEGLCRYCLEDAQLVADILDKSGMMDLTVRRCLLLGVGLDRAWTSIPSFEHLYIESLHERGYVAPTLGVDPFPHTPAPGGAILAPQSGLYDNVWVFDFKSLYPTVMRTFNIDPLSFVPPEKLESLGSEEREGLIKAPNGARFRRAEACAEGGRRGEAILPEILDRFFERREDARRSGDRTASYVYKIVMNSFYGVFGARGSRFASGHIAGAITGFGQHLLKWCEDWFTRRGYRVLYGDTDSLFVLSGLPQGASERDLLCGSGEICGALNSDLARYVDDAFRTRSYLELEFDTLYFRFFLPPVRSGSAGAVKRAPNGDGAVKHVSKRDDADFSEGAETRGRAKGYAGLTVPVSQLQASTDPREQHRAIDVVGMEAARRDWTDLARGFQRGILNLVFLGDGAPEVREYARRVVRELRAGALDEKLVYRKALRKPIGAYTHSTPPHVKAASLLEPAARRGIIRYVWTPEGPRPAESWPLSIDYDHYVEKQLKPIAQGFTETLKTEIAYLFGEEEQLDLFR
jgi:DNA polymerase-2